MPRPKIDGRSDRLFRRQLEASFDYVESLAGGGAALPLSGGTMTGPLITAAPATDAGFNLTPAISDPSSPNDGDVWRRTADLRVRIGGTSYSVAFVNGAQTFTGKKTFSPSSAGGAFLNLPPGVAPSAPVDGDFWTETTGAFAQINGVTKQLDAGASVDVVEVDFTSPSSGRFFDVALAGASVGQQVVAVPSLDMPAGLEEDELELEPIFAHGRVLSAGNIRLFVGAVHRGPVHGKRNISVTLG